MADMGEFLLLEGVKEACQDFIEEKVTGANKDLSLELYLICERYNINADRILTVSIPLILADCKLSVKGVTISYSEGRWDSLSHSMKNSFILDQPTNTNV